MTGSFYKCFSRKQVYTCQNKWQLNPLSRILFIEIQEILEWWFIGIDLICKKFSFSLKTLELLEMDTFILGITTKSLGTESLLYWRFFLIVSIALHNKNHLGMSEFIFIHFKYLTSHPENEVEIDVRNQVLVIKWDPSRQWNGKVVDENKMELIWLKKCHSLSGCTVGIELDGNFLIRLLD